MKISLERSVHNVLLELSSSEKIGEMAKKKAKKKPAKKKAPPAPPA